LRRLLVIELIAVATLSAVGAVGFHRVFAGRSFLGPVLGAAVLPVIVSAAARARHCRFITSLLLSIGGFVVYAVYAALGGTAPNLVPTATTFRELTKGLTGGWADLLSTSLPAKAEPRLLVVACAVVWLGAFLGAELAQRSRNVVAPTIPPLAAYAYTLLYAAGQPRSSRVLPLALTAATLLLVLAHANRWASIEPGGLRVRSGDDGAEASVELSADRRMLIGLPVICAALFVAVAASALPTAALRSSFDPRQFRSQELVARDVVSPLADVRRQLLYDPPQPMFSVGIERLSDALLIPRIRLATLDRFDGASWSSTGQFARVGTVLPDVPKLDIPQHQVGQAYTIDGLSGPWLPSAEYPAAIQTGTTPLEVQFDSSSGNLITAKSSLKDVTYGVNSLVISPEPDQLQRLQPGTGKAFEVTTDTQGMPVELRNLAARITAGATTTYAQLSSLQQALHDNYGYSERVGPGHSYGRLLDFLTRSRVGYSEQFAAAFAVMARSLGVPSRLAVGYLTSEPGKAGASFVPDGIITSRQVHVWPEVYLQGAGWVTFDPTPLRIESPPPPKPPEQAPVEGGGVVDAAQQPSRLPDSTQPSPPQRHHKGLSNRWLALGALVVLAVALPLWMLALKALVRLRRRRRARTTSQQILNSWAEAVDRLLEVGVPLQHSMTAREVAGRSIEYVSPAATALLYEMAPLVTTTLYAPSEPAPERAARMAELVNAFSREVTANHKLTGRLAAALSPKPLLYARR
jgi:transglutaminase-like putative cysteine protease